MLGLALLAPPLKRPLPLMSAATTSPSSPMTMGPFCQFQPPMPPPRIPPPSILSLASEKSIEEVPPPSVAPIHQPAKSSVGGGGPAS
jgi:hypothetical protein